MTAASSAGCAGIELAVRRAAAAAVAAAALVRTILLATRRAWYMTRPTTCVNTCQCEAGRCCESNCAHLLGVLSNELHQQLTALTQVTPRVTYSREGFAKQTHLSHGALLIATPLSHESNLLSLDPPMRSPALALHINVLGLNPVLGHQESGQLLQSMYPTQRHSAPLTACMHETPHKSLQR